MNEPIDPVQRSESGALMTPQSGPLSTEAPYLPPASMWLDSSQEEEGVNLVGLLHSLRRRWLPASLIGILVASIIGFLLYLLIPVTYEAVSLVRVSQDNTDVFGSALRRGEYDVFKETQQTLMTSPFVLEAALRDPQILALETLRREENKLAFLQSELSAGFPSKGEILRLSMRGKRKDDITKIVDAVVDAYLEEIAASGRRENVDRLEILRRSHKEQLDGIRDRSDKIHKLAEELGTPDSDLASMLERIELSRLQDLGEKRASIEAEYERLQMQATMLQAKSQGLKITPHKFDIENALQNQPKFRALQEELDFMDQQMGAMQGTVRPGSPVFTRMQAERGAIEQELARLRRELTPRISHGLMREFYDMDETKDEVDSYVMATQAGLVGQRLKNAEDQYNEQLEKVTSMSGYSSELVLQKTELRGLQDMADDIGYEITKLEMSLSAPNRIQRVQPALVPNLDSFWFKMMQIVAACLATFGATVLGIAVWDFLSKRMNSGEELQKAVGIPVIGSLPAIQASGFALLGHRGTNEAVITDSIDSIRAAITYGDRGSQTRSVVVTSAVGQEGKSTVASQLAVSLARGGRRTLLIDGDVRNPVQHGVFGLSADRGLCEVLREQTGLEDVVQTTPAENLWVLPAGRCDTVSFRALSSDGLAKLMERLASQFDFIVVDSGPVLTGPEALIFGQYVDGAILSTRRDISQLPKVDEAYHRLQSVGVHVIGSVVNGGTSVVRSSSLALTSAR